MESNKLERNDLRSSVTTWGNDSKI